MRHMFTAPFSRLIRLARNDKGSVALIFGLLLIPLVLAAGVGIDYARAVQFKAQLQAATDDAALAGAAAYTNSSSSGQTLGTAAATNYMNKAISALPANNGVTFTATPTSTSSNGTVTSFQMTVTATATFPTTLMAIYKPTLTITTTATANNPIVDATIDMSGFSSSACDTNSIYWYVVPTGGGVPSASAMNLIWANNSSTTPTTTTIQVASSVQIGFALENVTGGNCGYGNNSYGAHQGDTQWFYSSLSPPDADFNIAPGGANTGSHGTYPSSYGDCSLQVLKGTTSHGSTTYGTPAVQCFNSSGRNENNIGSTYSHGTTSYYDCISCLSSGTTMANAMTTLAAPTCSNMAGNSYKYFWNDGGGSGDDDYDYNDMEYAFSCSGGSGSGNGTSTSGITLTN
jgi:Flp pilus assembly protein TadG